MSATPRTDAARTLPYKTDDGVSFWVEQEFARDLERELAEAREELVKVERQRSESLNLLHRASVGDQRWRQDYLHLLHRPSHVVEIREPNTFEAHGHTWTRHTPGDPCPVPGNAMVHAYDGVSDIGPYRADSFAWDASRHQSLGVNIIGWRYAEKPLPPAIFKGAHPQTVFVPPDPGHFGTTMLSTASKCGQYADKHLAPSVDDPSTITPKPL